MSRFQNSAKHCAWLVLALLMLACDPWFAYSPFEAQLEDAYRGTHQKNLDRIEALDIAVNIFIRKVVAMSVQRQTDIVAQQQLMKLAPTATSF